MNLEKLKDQARKFEQKEDWRRAIEVYLRAIDEFESGREPTPDLSLYNRIGDLYMKARDTTAAVKSYERAVDLYADQGFYNNAIALCSKILRVQPGRMPVHLRLAYLHAHKNVLFEAKRHLIEYLERMNTAGQREDGIAAMAAFADQFAGNTDVRLMLIDLLLAANRQSEAVEQLRKVVPELESRGDTEALDAAMERLRELDPDAAAAMLSSRPDTGADDGPIVFIDTAADLADDVEPGGIEGLTLERSEEALTLDESEVNAVADLDSAAIGIPPEQRDDVQPIDGLVLDASGGVSELGAETTAPPPDLDLETASEPLDFDVIATPVEGLDRPDLDALGLEIERAADDEFAPAPDTPLEPLEPVEPLEPSDELLDLPPITLESDAGEAPGEIELGPPAQPLDFDLVGSEESSDGSDLTFLDVDEGRTDGAIAELEDLVLDDPANPAPHAALGQALADAGQDARAVEELELAVARYDERNELAGAIAATEAILSLRPDDVRYHQKAVELAFRQGERRQLLEAYQRLGDALARAGEADKAAAVFRRMMEHDPAGHGAAGEPGAPATAAAPAEPASTPPERSDDFVDLGSLVLEAEGPRDTRMKMEGHEEPPTSGDEQRDFDEMLDAFKRGIEENLGEDDHQAHYDLGIAFKEMGLLDEAIGEFQKALRGSEGRLRTAEALGQSFYEKDQFGIAETVLRRALEEPGGDDQKIGVIYWLGRALEAQGKRTDASACYERALAVDIRFMDLSERVQRLTADRGA